MTLPHSHTPSPSLKSVGYNSLPNFFIVLRSSKYCPFWGLICRATGNSINRNFELEISDKEVYILSIKAG